MPEQTYTLHDPYDQTELGTFPFTPLEQVETQLAMLREAQSIQRGTAAWERAKVLARLAELLSDNAEELATLITRETGKTISDSRIEMKRAVNAAVASSEESRQVHGECLDSDAYADMGAKLGIVSWAPLGTILCITPFNFPVNIAIHKIGPAYAAGNSILFKPSPYNTLSSRRLVELCYEAGIPREVLQLCIPDATSMNQLNAHKLIDGINFTGGDATARVIAASSGYKKLLFELGGNDPLIVMDDADLAAATAAAINHRFATAGQRCTAAKRLFVHSDIYERFRDLLIEKSLSLKVGDPKDDDTFVGPLINAAAAIKVRAQIEESIRQGATVALGNRYDNTLVYPTILENTGADNLVMQEEVFGPVMPLFRFDSIEELITVVNDSQYGLQGGVFSNNLAVVRRLFAELELGTLAVNEGPGFRTEHFPFGGVKTSGIGREGISYAIREMSRTKTLVL